MARKKRNAALGCMCAVLGLLFLYFVLFVPIDLSVKVISDKVYAGQRLGKEDFSVRTRTFLGVGRKVDAYSVTSADGNVTVTIGYRNLRKKVHMDVVKPVGLEASYDGSVYVGQLPDAGRVSMVAEYEDGTVGDVPDPWVDSVSVGNVEDTYSMHVYSDLGDAYVDVPVISPESMSASYEHPVVGDEFNLSNVLVHLNYADGTKVRIQDFVVNDSKTDMDGNAIEYDNVKNDLGLLSYPLYLSGEVRLFAISPYGTTEFTVVPEEPDKLRASYDGDVYEGDTLDDSKIRVTMKNDGEKHDLTEYRFTNPGPIAMDMDIRIPTKYGTAVLKVKPIKVSGVSVDVGDGVSEGDKAEIESITLKYEDGSDRTLDLVEVEFLNMPKTWQLEQTVWFVYHGVEYSFDVNPVLSGVADLRSGKEQMQRYEASDDVIEKLTLICQRICDKSLSVAADEISLMANRYELYGGGVPDADKLLEYVETCGYWGDKDDLESISSVANDDVSDVVRDALVNGYRSLPQYVDERVLSNNVSNGTWDDVRHYPLVTKDNREVRFYVSEQDDTSMLYCYTENAYRSVVGTVPPSVDSGEGDGSDASDGQITVE